MDEGMIDITKIPRIEFQVNNEQLKSCIKQLHTTSKVQQKLVQKLKKDVQARPLQQSVADALTIVNANIEIDPSLLKLINVKEGKKIEDSPLKNSANVLGCKVNQISDCMRLIFSKLANIEKKIQSNEADARALVNQKSNSLQNQLDEYKKNQNKEIKSINDTLKINISEYEDKLRQIESKTIWQINDCKTKLNDRVNEQMVKDSIKEAEGKIMTKVKESMIKSNIDPNRIDNLQAITSKIEKQFANKFVECHSRLTNLSEHVEASLTNKKEFNEQKLDNQKRFGAFQTSFLDFSRKIKEFETVSSQSKAEFNKIASHNELVETQLQKMRKVLSNLKLSDDFQKLIEKLDPHKICQIDTSIQALTAKDLRLERQLNSIKLFVEKLRQKSQICNLLAPKGDSGQKLNKQQIQKIFNELTLTNPQFKKIQTLQGAMLESKSYGEMINQVNKRISRIQKQFDIQTVVYGLKGLEEYLKKELLIITSRLNQLEGMINEDRKKRPISARKPSQSKLGSSVSYKKLTPVDCISCFQTPLERNPYSKKY